MKNIYLPAFLLATIPALALAMDAVDADGDGLVSPAELTAAYPDLSETAFVDLDLDGDEMLNAEELARGADLGFLPAATN